MEKKHLIALVAALVITTLLVMTIVGRIGEPLLFSGVASDEVL